MPTFSGFDIYMILAVLGALLSLLGLIFRQYLSDIKEYLKEIKEDGKANRKMNEENAAQTMLITGVCGERHRMLDREIVDIKQDIQHLQKRRAEDKES